MFMSKLIFSSKSRNFSQKMPIIIMLDFGGEKSIMRQNFLFFWEIFE